MALFAELKRRKVFTTTAAYLAAAFVVAQVTQLLVDGFGLSPTVLKIVLIAEIVALPLVIGLAWAFDLTPEGVEHTTTSKVRVSWKRVGLPILASILLLLAALAFLSLNKTEKLVNRTTVAVMPFHVSGDPQIAYLREGMVDLLAVKLTGEGGPRAADPRAVLSASKRVVGTDEEVSEESASAIARQVGAGQVLIGTVVGSPAQFSIHAKLMRTGGGRIAEADETGSATTLAASVDKLVAKLLSLQAGEGPQRLELLTTTSLDALRAYLDAQAAFRSAHFGRAAQGFRRAVELDSTFALAALGAVTAGNWGEGPPIDLPLMRRILTAHRDRLGPVDRAIADAWINMDPQKARSNKEIIRAWEAVVQLAPDRPDVWFEYGDVMTHTGATADMPDAQEQADRAFARALQLDSMHLPALQHMMDDALWLGRLDVVRKLEPIRRARDPDETAALYARPWRIRVLGDTAAVRAERAALDTMGMDRSVGIPWIGWFVDGGVPDAVRAVERRVQIAGTPDARYGSLLNAATLYLYYGMPARAARAAEDALAIAENPLEGRNALILDALYGDGAVPEAEKAAADINGLLAGQSLIWRVRAECAREQWRLWHGNSKSFAATLQHLAAVPGDSLVAKVEANVCTRTLATINAVQNDPTGVPTRFRSLDAALRDGPAMSSQFLAAANIVLARAAERAGDITTAYHAAGRAPLNAGAFGLFGTMQRERARLAALTGHRDEAIRLYTSYFRAHAIAEPSFKKIDDAARAHLAQLTAEGK